ncbi:MAG TPA: RNA polymerase sigma factor [Candidatus Deferrimicrobium sp.]|nr:RNA polymerase sigma factor [Candidatus Kapabacteria bacterium]HLP60162.1 RNA polymerase sigma factor [Candidatus Deferrimicrobium sp.]
MKELIERLKKKDEAALKEVMSMFKHQVFNYLHLMLGNRELAEELTQDTFVKVYFKAGSLETEYLKAWIFKIATNLARSEFRKRKIKKLLSLSDVNDIHYSYKSNLENEITLEQMLSTLPEKYRIPVIMKDIDEFSFEEMAAILKKPVGTVKSLVFRGHQQMKNLHGHQPALQNGGILNEQY